VTGRVAAVLPGENAASSDMVDAWLADATPREVVAVAAEVLGRDVTDWWRDPLNRFDLTSPVQWEATSRALVEAGATSVVEIGPAPVLGPLIRQVHPDLPVHLASGPDVPFATDDPEPALAGPAAHRGET
jgi:hypothetical protein